jgi:hypothetical protein
MPDVERRVAHPVQAAIGLRREQVAFNDAQAIGRMPLQQPVQQRRAVVARFNRHVADVEKARRHYFTR